MGSVVDPIANGRDLRIAQRVAFHRHQRLVEPGDGAGLSIELRPRDGGIWVLYPERPFSLRLELADASVHAGGTLRYTAQVINHAGQPVPASHILRVFVTDPDGGERPDLGGDRVTASGVLEVAQPIAVNEQPGTWTLCVTDILTRRTVRRTFDVLAPEPQEAHSPQTPRNSDPRP